MSKLTGKRAFGTTGIELPPIVFGTSAFGNLYEEVPFERKLEIARGFFEHVSAPVAVDCAGKYGAGLALESLGQCLGHLGVSREAVLISNKLGWEQVALEGSEPTFEPGVWKGLSHDAVQSIDYEGIKRCWAQGNELLGSGFDAELVSVHDPDEYLEAVPDARKSTGPPAMKSGSREPAAAGDLHGQRKQQVLEAYRALFELKDAGKVKAVGIGAKNWRVIEELAEVVDFDWVMLACSLTVYRHPPALLALVERLADRGVGIINSAVFNSGFLAGGRYFDYAPADPKRHPEIFRWRESFLALCRRHDVPPAAACVEFGLSAPGVASVSLNTTKPERVVANVAAVRYSAPRAFWREMKERKLIDPEFPFLG